MGASAFATGGGTPSFTQAGAASAAHTIDPATVWYGCMMRGYPIAGDQLPPFASVAFTVVVE
jgi:hypothetical protein